FRRGDRLVAPPIGRAPSRRDAGVTRPAFASPQDGQSIIDAPAACNRDPHALNVIAALASPGSRALWLWHLISPYLYLQKIKLGLSAAPHLQDNYSAKLWCGQ